MVLLLNQKAIWFTVSKLPGIGYIAIAFWRTSIAGTYSSAWGLSPRLIAKALLGNYQLAEALEAALHDIKFSTFRFNDEYPKLLVYYQYINVSFLKLSGLANLLSILSHDISDKDAIGITA